MPRKWQLSALFVCLQTARKRDKDMQRHAERQRGDDGKGARRGRAGWVAEMQRAGQLQLAFGLLFHWDKHSF